MYELPQPYLNGFLTVAGILISEHVLLYSALHPRGDKWDDVRVAVKFIIGVAAILIGCFVVRWYAPLADPFLTPLVCALAGITILFGYIGRWLFGRAVAEAETRGWLKGLADREDYGTPREPTDRHP